MVVNPCRGTARPSDFSGSGSRRYAALWPAAVYEGDDAVAREHEDNSPSCRGSKHAALAEGASHARSDSAHGNALIPGPHHGTSISARPRARGDPFTVGVLFWSRLRSPSQQYARFTVGFQYGKHQPFCCQSSTRRSLTPQEQACLQLCEYNRAWHIKR